MHRTAPLLTVTLGLALAVLAMDVVWLVLAPPFALVGDELRAVGVTVLTLAIAAAAARLVERRIAGDGSRIAAILRYVARAGFLFAAWKGFFYVFTWVAATGNYLVMTTALPLWDTSFAALDAGIGFDWVGTLAWVDARPWAAALLVDAYASTIVQMTGALVFFSLALRGDRLLEFGALYVMTLTMVVGVAMLMPALGAYAHHAPDPALYDGLTDKGYVHLPTLEGLRAGTFGVLSFHDLVGMISFPSFHTVLAIMLPYLFRGYRLLFAPLCALNAVVILSTLPEGGHYLVDVFSGAAIAGVSILIVRALRPAPAGAAPAGAVPQSA